MPPVMIPVLPCSDFDETLLFWKALDFKNTYRQEKPYPYAVMVKNDWQLHFRQEKRLDIHNNYCINLLIVSDVAAVHQQFTQAMKAYLGKVPATGLPRITRFKTGQTRFTLTDISGNGIIVIQSGEADQKNYEAYDNANLTPLQKAIALARRLREYKEDDKAAIKTLVTALKKAGKEERENINIAVEMLIDMDAANEKQYRTLTAS
ncbi:VOC family protein [Chitinophaga arvensicola]|uniref:Glyoxalase-like domain-containing protein n=1 Tax=Chitinophaga arvensicola TaxID=29529 RepID=A0A1I0R4C6_9BACT|nr:hypothetical protein [Chitinophaga arvensicola]SEW35391.1 hypothetical protein SAMN04488122_2234 [Chitinophaga arvensicola]